MHKMYLRMSDYMHLPVCPSSLAVISISSVGSYSVSGGLGFSLIMGSVGPYSVSGALGSLIYKWVQLDRIRYQGALGFLL